MGKKSKPPPGPDWQALLAQSEKFNEQNQAQFAEYMDFMKSSYADQKESADAIADIQLPAMQDEAALSQELRDNYREMGIPFEKEYVDKLSNWDTEGRRDERAGTAQAGIGMAQDAQRQAELRRLEGYGIDPSQTRSAALDSSLGLASAVSKAAAGNQQRNQVEQEGLQYGATAIDTMRGWPQMGGQNLSQSIAAGNAALGAQQGSASFMGNAYGQGGNMLAQGWNATQGAYGTAGNLHQNDLQRHQMIQDASPMKALGSLVGTGLSAYATGGLSFLGKAEGGPVKNMAEGGTAQPNASVLAQPRPASEGIPPDNVPTNLSPGEFVIPDDVARWEGEKSLQKIINKAREDRTTTEQQRAQNQQALGIPLMG